MRLLQAAQKLRPRAACHDDVWQFVAQMRDGERRLAALAEAYPEGARERALAKLLKVPLYPYQAEGALFAARAGRVLIGDEMGLGKTIQAIAAAELMARHFGVERVLVVCPTSLKHQWEREIARFTEREAQVIDGLRADARAAVSRRDASTRSPTTTRSHRDLDLIAAWAPDLVILDEAQRIKNWNTRTARSVKRIASPYAIVLTGTPLENRLEELVSIVQFVDQHRLGPDLAASCDEHQVRDEAGRVIGYRTSTTSARRWRRSCSAGGRPRCSRSCPSGWTSTSSCRMTPEQMRHHDENREHRRAHRRAWRDRLSCRRPTSAG